MTSPPIGLNIRRLTLLIALAFLATSVGVGYWTLDVAGLQGDPYDPRLYATLRDRPRGTILAANGTELARSERGPNGYVRRYADRSLAQMLESGEIDALITARTPSTFRRGGGAVRRLFEHPFEVERDYFRRTGIFPIMHTLVVKKEILEANPWVAFTLFKAFSEAKDLAMADLTQTSALPLSLPFLVEHAYQTMDLMGEDFWPYGLESNRRTLETFVRYMHEQGLIPEPMALETLFPESTQRTFRV